MRKPEEAWDARQGRTTGTGKGGLVGLVGLVRLVKLRLEDCRRKEKNKNSLAKSGPASTINISFYIRS
jgi:hypothetical protein